ncbi:lytic polysaccharide monooxygenase [Lentithecium fluviatile CBS 122367]|uniref:Lytic polysaccharide monooxygenase n=1 Tax=Lentithecium fluviatile CBS 122367 TaxID=1168545 RepID=A0A6G1JKR1_9PLEO|nr:lytic polysaccharide monooxygenase [Lentithecium fluviatile CBS 122367]
MILTTLTVLGSLLTLAPSATAHILIAEPKPFGLDAGTANFPLDPSGSNYPCKATSSAGGPMNQFTVGQNGTLSFTGSAVHGGGSCQLAVTTDKNPTKESKFKVIHSIEGGCPGVGGPATFSFPVPEELPNGEAVFAWTWFNHIGNREMYMNCALITVSGGKDDTAAFDALPDLALANIKVGTGASCTTKEGNDYTFKDPGKSVVRIGAGPFVELCSGASSGGAGSGAGSGAAPEAPAASNTPNNGAYTPPAAQAPAATSQAPASAAPSAPAASSPPPAASTTAPASPSQPAAVTSTTSTLVTLTAPASGIPSAAPTQVPGAAQPSEAPAAGGGVCSTDGELVCNGETQWGLCNNGKVVFQPVAAGTKCQGGKIAKRGLYHRNQRTAVKYTV